MSLIPAQALDDIRARLDIVELVREYVPEVKQAGRNMKGCCPFHSERTPSFIINHERQSFHCFGCGEGGDAFAFLMKIENLSFTEAAEKLAERTGVKIVKAQEVLGPQERERLKIKEAIEFASDFYHDILLKAPEAAPARAYLDGRGVSPESVAAFKLGFASSRANLVGQAGRKGFTPEILVKAGLAAAKEGGGFRDYFYNRVLYPIRDARGSTVGFGARTMGDAEPKYLNSADSPVFSKGKILYGLFNGLAQVRKARKALLMEGYMDVIAAHQYGLPYACAPLGTAVTPDQATLLKRYVSDVTVVFDADKAGLVAAIRGAEILLNHGLGVRVTTVPEGKDPDEHLRNFGVESFKACLAKAVDLVEFKTEQVLKKYAWPLSPENKSAVAKEVLPTIMQCQDEVLKGEWLHRLAGRIKINEEDLRKQLNKEEQAPAPKVVRKNVPALVSPVEIPNADLRILTLLVKKPDLAGRVRESDLNSAAAGRILKALIAVLEETDATTPSWSSSWLEALAPGDRPLVSKLLVDDRVDETPEASLDILLERHRGEARLRELEPLVLAMGGENPIDSNLREEYRKLVAELKGTKRR